MHRSLLIGQDISCDSNMSLLVRGDVKFIMAGCSQNAAAFNSYIHIASPISVGYSWLLNIRAAASEF